MTASQFYGYGVEEGASTTDDKVEENTDLIPKFLQDQTYTASLCLAVFAAMLGKN